MCNAFSTWQSLKASLWVSDLLLPSMYRCYSWTGTFHCLVARWTEGEILKGYRKPAPAIISGCAFFRSSSIHFALIKLHTQQLSCLFKLSLSVLYGYKLTVYLSQVTSHLHSPLYNTQLYISSSLISRLWMLIKYIYIYIYASITSQDIYSSHSQCRTS